VIANGISSICKSISVTTKGWKEVKWEIKENLKVEIDVFVEKRVFEDKRKDAEIEQWREIFEEPEWLKSVQVLAQRSDELEAQLRRQAFIRAEERPMLGEEALEASAAEEEQRVGEVSAIPRSGAREPRTGTEEDGRVGEAADAPRSRPNPRRAR
jgi:hypothetical protein